MARKTGKRPVAVAPVPTVTPLDFMIEAYCDPSLPFGDRLRAAIAAAPFIHRRQPQAGGGEVPDHVHCRPDVAPRPDGSMACCRQ